MSLFRFCQNPFTKNNPTLQRLMNFGGAQLDRFTADNPGGIWTARITGTAGAMTALDTGMADNAIKAAILKAQVQAKGAFRDGLPPRVGRIYNAVALQYGDPSPELTECFPLGRAVFSGCTDGALNDNLMQLKTCLTPKAPPLAAGLVTEATALLTTWNSLFTATGTAKGNKKMMEAARQAAKTALANELFKNLLTFALNFPDNEVKFAEFVPENLLEAPATPGAPGAATLSAGAWNAGTHLVTLTMQADGATVFTVQRRLVGEVNFSMVVDDAAADAGGHATFDDEIPAGHYEYRVLPRNGDVAGDPSNVVSVLAA